MRESIVLYPYPAMGHLVAMVEFGKRFLLLHSSFSVVVVVADPPFKLPAIDSYVENITSSCPLITFQRLPPVPCFHATDYYPPRQRTLVLAFEFVRLSNFFLYEALKTISLSTSVAALFLDFFGAPAMDVAAELEIPPYFFFASPAVQLAVFLYFPAAHRQTTGSYKDLRDTILRFPGVPPLPAPDIPQGMDDRNHKAYYEFLDMGERLAGAAGVVINTCDAFEPRALKALSEGDCVVNGPTPPIYSVGPVVADDKDSGGAPGSAECLSWLDSQPSQSVVFVNFGSMFSLGAAQLKEIATGLERSGQRFLWVVRGEDPNAEMDTLLPDGFADRVQGRGLLLRSWAPQVAVLNRESVGGFVTHCGWNSVLEAIQAGVPMLAWPLYAEQKLIRAVVVKDMKVAMAVEMDEKGFVNAAELEGKVKALMESEEGKATRVRAEALKGSSKAALKEGGSSQVAMLNLAKALKKVKL